jgi:predicted anti-sigma-YlaC factor YlaD
MMNEHLSPDLLVDFLHGELAPEDDALAHAHLSTCADCRRAYDLEASLAEAIRSAAKADEREMPSLISAFVWEQVRQAKPGPFARVAGWLRPAIALPVAAAIVLGGWFASPYAHPGNKPSVNVMYYLQTHAAQAGSPLLERSDATTLETSMLGDSTPPMIAEHVDAAYADDASSALVAAR